MAEKYIKTTSSSVLDGKNDKKLVIPTHEIGQASQLPSDATADPANVAVVKNDVSNTATIANCSNSTNPKNVQILTKLANNLSESYQLVKQRQQKYYELSAKMGGSNAPQLLSYNNTNNQDCEDVNAGEWQEVKNKLKRKKQLSTSLTSVNDSVNQEKRTRIEGIQLNCRGKLQLPTTTATAATYAGATRGQTNNIGETQQRTERSKQLTTSPLTNSTTTSNTTTPAATPVVNKDMKMTQSTAGSSSGKTISGAAAPPPRLKRKLQENVQTIQKLNALTEQLRLEINELKTNLTTERGAVRVLRAQNESETRKWKNEVKRLQNALEIFKKKSEVLPTNGAKKPNDGGNENLPTASTTINNVAINHEVQRLTNEVIALKEANRVFEEKKMINCDADRRKAADMRTLKDSYEIRLTQLTKSAKNEISRLLEEIKSKERSIGQLKKELQTFQTRPKSQIEVKSRNATINQQTTNKTTKPKKIKNKSLKTNNRLNEINASTTVLAKKTEDSKVTACDEAQNPNEVKKLNEIELINNTKNLQLSKNIVTTAPSKGELSNDKLTTATTKTRTNINTNTTTNQILTHTKNNHKPLKPLQSVNLNNLNVNVDNEQIHNSNKNNNNNITSTTTKIITTTNHNENCNNLLKTTTLCTPLQVDDVNLREQLGQTLENRKEEEEEEQLLKIASVTEKTTPTTRTNNMCTTTTTQTTETNERHHNNMHDDRTKDNNSDADSALSSAPPSISPQPPPTGLDTADIWQMIRTYSTDLQKLQKDNEILQKENEHIHAELNLAKEQILDVEKSSIETNSNAKIQQLMVRVKQLEEREHQLNAEADELREQNELLEFRILELEETNDKWSLQSHTNNSTTSSTSQTVTLPTGKNVWANREDPMQMVFGKCANGETNMYSGITSPHTSQRHEEEGDVNLMDPANEEIRRRITQMLKKSTLDSDDKHCLQQLIQLVQHLDLMTQRSEPNSLNTTTSCSSDEANSLDMVKSRISDYSSASSPSSARSAYEISNSNNNSSSRHQNCSKSLTKTSSYNPATPLSNAARIVATVSPYNSSPQHHNNNNSGQNQLVPTNTPTDSPRKFRHSWQSNSLSESGVFVESDFLSDASEQNAGTQTDFEDESVAQAARELCNELQKLQGNNSEQKISSSSAANREPALSPNTAQYSPNLSEQKRLQYYKERLALLESKILIYESSGDLQTKHLADRLQREILLEKELKELRDRVEFLESENLTLEEEKCEFEEAENDTRLRLQRLEVELEILSQRNVELEMSREALGAKYKDCRSECLNLRDDLAASEQQIRHLDEDKQKAKENLEIFHNLLPLLLTYHTTLVLSAHCTNTNNSEYLVHLNTLEKGEGEVKSMGNVLPLTESMEDTMSTGCSGNQYNEQKLYRNETPPEMSTCVCQYLKEEVKCLRNQIKDMNSRHYEAMESADSHWVELERQYKDREEAYRAKECCLKSKIQKLQDCLRDDARAANEKIFQLEETESELKNCLVRVSKEHRDLMDEHEFLNNEQERMKEQLDALTQQQKPTVDQLEQEKKHNKTLNDELSFMRKLQQETETRNFAEMESLQSQLFELKKEFLHIEVTNSELKEEVVTLEQQIVKLQSNEKECEDKIRVLQDEVKSKEEMVQKLEKRLERSEGYSLAQELSGSPSKRLKREDVKDLKTASTGLGYALRNFKECETSLPSHQQFSSVARDVKRLADSLLHGESLEDEAPQRSVPKLILTDITHI